MPGFLQGAMQKSIGKAFSKTFYAMTLYKQTITTDGMGGSAEAYASGVALKGMADTYSDYAVANGIARVGDYKLLVLQHGAGGRPEIGDMVKFTHPATAVSHSVKVVNVNEDPAGATWECQARAGNA